MGDIDLLVLQLYKFWEALYFIEIRRTSRTFTVCWLKFMALSIGWRLFQPWFQLLLLSTLINCLTYSLSLFSWINLNSLGRYKIWTHLNTNFTSNSTAIFMIAGHKSNRVGVRWIKRLPNCPNLVVYYTYIADGCSFIHSKFSFIFFALVILLFLSYSMILIIQS